MKTKEKIALILILILAVALRFYNLSSNPPALNWDEVSHGYNAYSILKTGKDEWGETLPLTNFRAYGDYPLPLYMYLSMPGILAFGLNEFTVRLPSALFGSLIVLAVFLLAKEILKSNQMALLAALLASILPWNLLINRQAIQATPALFLLSFGSWLFLKGLNSARIWTIMGTVLLGLSAYAYHNTRILAPLFLLLLLVIHKDVLLKSKKFLSTLICISLALLFLPTLAVFSKEGSARSNWVGILDQGAINDINLARTSSILPNPLPKLIYNRPTYFLTKAASNYLSYFNPVFLSLEGGTHYQFSVPHFGLIFPTLLPFYYFALIYWLLHNRKIEQEKKFLLGWLFLAPLPAAITRDSYQVVRAYILIPPVLLLSSWGFWTFWQLLKEKSFLYSKVFLALFSLSLIFLFGNYLYNLWFIYPYQYSFAWQYGYKQVAEYVLENKAKYQEVVITKQYGEPHEFILFYTKYDPKFLQNDPNFIRYEKSNWFWVDSFDSYRFINDWEIKEKTTGLKNTLLVTSPGNYPEQARVVKTIKFLDQTPAFDIVGL